ncbi:DUF4965 domain-containing protein [Anaerocolumna sedimenticola]|uniref:DUF4965 domain-containing protein n=1 Tax=Anaerocolumna sedimenticola TaxID=2696063 RepID=A0A6P1TQJ3_9FIRM|nr:DUF4965 domain-containing protein [Anaerocolumna sedimenticola]QHQ63224.1 DUF4965 domain-containing protein [Anaerocolumna sedimenticola]
MEIERIASVPLILHDPYFGIWSPSDKLYETDTQHWSKAPQRIYGYVNIDGAVYCFLGNREFHPEIEQKSVEVTATATKYTFENEKIKLTVCFTSPLLLDNPVLVSRPCTYIDYEITRKQEAEVRIDFIVTSDLVCHTPGDIIGGNNDRKTFHYAYMGKAGQHPLGHSGDNITIDWGFVYLAADESNVTTEFEAGNHKLIATAKLGKEKNTASMIIAYDDLLSIFYFGSWQKAYWTKEYETILEAIEASFKDKAEVLKRAELLDKSIESKAEKIGGKDYVLLCNISYRHAIAAHKLITDKEGNLIFLSKENDSNGCIGTVDVSYPSVPLFLLYDTEYVKGMLRPVFYFAKCPVWEYDFAPHDVGRYPYAAGQVYGLNGEHEKKEFRYDNGNIFPFYYMYPSGSKTYDIKYQMPVEECGNMLILTAVVCALDKSAEFAKPHYELLKQWTEYLLTYGADPGEQLCTDDFAGHLSHNVNLSAKAIMGIEAFSQLAKQMGEDAVSEEYHQKAAVMAKDWEVRSLAGDHYRLTFDNPDSWSLKYNLVWDKFFGSSLFSREVFEKEIAYYINKNNTYGVPLDSRRDYTKSDWILWCAALAEDKEQAEKLISPVAEYVRKTTSRVPFSDWYETVTGEYCHFIARSVQGGIYMPMLIK